MSKQQFALAGDEVLVRGLKLGRTRAVHVGEGLRTGQLLEDQGPTGDELVEALGQAAVNGLGQDRRQPVGHGLLKAAVQALDVAEQAEDRSHPDPGSSRHRFCGRLALSVLQEVDHGGQDARPAYLGPGPAAVDRRACQGALHQISNRR